MAPSSQAIPMSTLTVLTLLISFDQAYSEFHTTCTTPSSRTNYVSSPDMRGTLDILWSCFFTIIACTWTIQHLNVPEQPGFDPRELRGCQAFRWNLRGIRRTLKWMLVTTIAPEYILGKALADFYAACRSKKMMRIYSQLDGVDWGLTHAFFANMGGFVLHQNLNESPDSEWPASGLGADDLHTRQQNPRIAMRRLDASSPIEDSPHKYADISRTANDSVEDVFVGSTETPSQRILAKLTNMRSPYGSEMETIQPHHRLDQEHALQTSQTLPRRFHFKEHLPPARGPVLELCAVTWESPILRGAGALPYYSVPFHLLADEIFALRQSGALSKLPKITFAEINDKSKGDTFVKLITSIQVLWFILQVIIRAIRKLSISQLEIAVTAFGICAIITYFFLLPKPKGVDVPITLKEFQGHIPIHQNEFESLRYRILQKYIRSLFVFGDGLASVVDIMGCHIPNDALNAAAGRELDVLHVGVSIGGIVFGAIHIAAWNLYFPTSIEQTLWRMSSVMSTVLLPTMYLLLLLNEYIIPAGIPTIFIKVWDILFGSLYVLARAFLLVEIFRTLFYLPEDAYVTTWASNFPHVS